MTPCNINSFDHDFTDSVSNYFTIEDFNSKFNSKSSDTNNQYNHNVCIASSEHLYSKSLSLIHINARSLNKNFDSIELLLNSLQSFQFSVIGVSETWLNTSSPPLYAIENYQMLRSDRGHRKGGGVAIYARNDLNFKLRSDLHIENTEHIFLEIVNNNAKNVIVGVIYRPPGHNAEFFLDKLDTCLNNITQENKDVYLMGDFNINLLNKDNNITSTFVNLLSSYTFHPHISNPTRISDTSKTLIDNIFSNVYNKKFNNGILYYDISDHLPIFTISNSSQPTHRGKQENHEFHRKETKHNIDSLKSDLDQEEWHNTLQQTDADMAYEIFIQNFLFYYNKNIPLVKAKTFNKTKQPWITKGIMRSISKRNNLYKEALKSENKNENMTEYKKYRNILTSIIRLSRKLFYSKKIETSKNNIKSLWETVNNLIGKNKRNDSNTFNINGQQTNDSFQIANDFNDYFTNVGSNLASNIDAGNSHFTDFTPPPCKSSLFLYSTHNHEIIKIVKNLKPSKSSGHDGISSYLLKHIINYIATPLSHIFNLSLSTGKCPNALKLAKVIPIYKKDDPSLITNYRPISLLPSISKILEKIVHKRLFNFLKQNKALIPNQFGFRKDHSTDYAILHLYDKIVNSLSKREHTVAIFMDLSKAFDTIDHQTLLYKLNVYGIRGMALSWFKDYLHNRQQYVSFKTQDSHKQIINCGVPQGSILGPLLFIIYINDIINSSKLLNFVIFADDTSVFYSHSNFNHLINLLNRELSRISQWFKCNKLSLNISKTNFMHFSKINSRRDNFVLTIDGLPLAEKHSTKFLGVTLDSNLSWNEHIHNVHTSAARNIGILYKMKEFVSEKSLLILYNSLVLSHINYCNVIWGNCSLTKINSLLLLQKRAVRTITNSGYLAHTEPLFNRLKTLRTHDIHSFQTGVFMYKYTNNQLPELFHNYFDLNSNIHTYPTRRSSDFHLENPKTILAQKSIRHHGPDVWNSLPNNIKQCLTLSNFKDLFKTYILSTYK